MQQAGGYPCAVLASARVKMAVMHALVKGPRSERVNDEGQFFSL